MYSRNIWVIGQAGYKTNKIQSNKYRANKIHGTKKTRYKVQNNKIQSKQDISYKINNIQGTKQQGTGSILKIGVTAVFSLGELFFINT